MWLRVFCALLLGALSVAGFAPVGWFYVPWLCFAALYLLLNKPAAWRRAALLGWAFGLAYFGVGVSWIYVSLATFGGMPMPFAAAATLAFCALMALYPALACGVFGALLRPRHSLAAMLIRSGAFAALWTLSEWLRGWVFTGFPWLSIGYSQTPPSPLAGVAPVLGVFGVSFCSVLLAALLAEYVGVLWAKVVWQFCSGFLGSKKTADGKTHALHPIVRHWRRKSLLAIPSRFLPSFFARHSATPLHAPPPKGYALCLLLLLAALLVGAQALRAISWSQAYGEPLSVALLQGNVAQDNKWHPEQFHETLRLYYQLAQENPAQLMIMPETAITRFLRDVSPDYLAALNQLASARQGNLITGVVLGDVSSYANGALSIGVDGEQTYRKAHLVPFGEFVPTGFSWFVEKLHIPLSNFKRGTLTQPLIKAGEQKIAINICYEDVFGEEIIARLPQATLLVNLSNIAWFGDSLAPAQHLQIAQMRALESGRMMLRATNTGVTAIIRADGTVVAQLPTFTRGALRGEVYAYRGRNPYIRWGNLPVLMLASFCVALALGITIKNRYIRHKEKTNAL